jgi:glycosyltransferase involved in cell wall biosynthesis
MRFLFWPTWLLPIHGLSLTQKPIGGMETALIRLANALAELGHHVTVLTPFKKSPRTLVRYMNFSEFYKTVPIDVLIAVKHWDTFLLLPQVKRRFFWTGDTPTSLQHLGIGDKRVVSMMEKALFVSDWQAKEICRISGFPSESVFIQRNGVDLREFAGSEERHPRRLMYASNPQRGLRELIPIYERLKKKYSDLELHIFSNAALYDMRWPPKIAADNDALVFLEKVAQIPGCYVRGTILQAALAREYMKSAILAYPCNCNETSCITIMEAHAAGCPTVTSDHGALPETVGEGGICIAGDPGTPDFDARFEAELDRLLGDRIYWESMSAKALNQSRSTDWQCRAKEFLEYLKRL